MSRSLRLALFVSGEGTTLEAVAEAIDGGHLPATIRLVVCDRPHAPAIERARRRGLPTTVLPMRGVPASAWQPRLATELAERRVELVVLAGFLSILPADWLREWAGRVINLHPALLPKFGGPGFYGRRVHEAVLASGDRESGATVHVVTAEVDGGPIVAQARVPVEPGDTPDSLRERLRPVETGLLCETIRRFSVGELPLPFPIPGAAAGPAGPS